MIIKHLCFPLQLEYNRTETHFLRRKYIIDELKSAMKPNMTPTPSTLIDAEEEEED